MKTFKLFLQLLVFSLSFAVFATVSDLTPTQTKELMFVPEVNTAANVANTTVDESISTATQKTPSVTKKVKKKVTLKELSKMLFKKPATSEANPDGLAIASLATGVGGLVLAFIPYVGWIGLAACICGIVFGAMAKKRGTSRKGMATAGMVCGIIGCALFVLGIIVLASVLATL